MHQSSHRRHLSHGRRGKVQQDMQPRQTWQSWKVRMADMRRVASAQECSETCSHGRRGEVQQDMQPRQTWQSAARHVATASPGLEVTSRRNPRRGAR